MVQPDDSSRRSHGAYVLRDENEQLRASLEAALEETDALAEDRDRLLRRVADLSRELQSLARIPDSGPSANETGIVRQSQTEEELRVAFEELQVLTEELEVANTSLQQTNHELDARVEQRTRELTAVNIALRATEASFRTISDLVPDLLWRADRRGEATWFNRRWFDHTGQGAEEPMGFGWLDAVHPDDRELSRNAWTSAIARGKPYQHEHRIRDAQSAYRWFLVRAEPLRDDSRILHWFAAGTDIHDQRMALDALRRSELRFRTLVEGMPQLVWRAADDGQWTWNSPQWNDYTGQSDGTALGMGWLDVVHPDDRDSVLTAWASAGETGNLEFESRILHANEQRHRHFRTRALPVHDASSGQVEWLGTSTDVDDIVRLQAQQAVLVDELQHRTRNLMAVVHAVTMRTLRGVASLEGFKKCIDDRLQALARVQGLLSRRESGMRVPFDVLLREELSAHVELDAEGRGAQVAIQGPVGVPLRSAMVQTLALALHELATNALKYGALSTSEGHLDVRWGVQDADGGKRLLWVDWRERGVSGMPEPGTNPRGGGYGRELIERALPYQLGARTTYAFEKDGVHCTIALVVPEEDISMEKKDG